MIVSLLTIQPPLFNNKMKFHLVDFKHLFTKEALYKKIKEKGKVAIQQVSAQLIDDFLKLLKLSKVKISTASFGFHLLNFIIKTVLAQNTFFFK